jgi:hypothetical protein
MDAEQHAHAKAREYLVIVDGAPEWFGEDEPVVVASDGMTFMFDWFEGCCVHTHNGAVEYFKDTAMIEYAPGVDAWTRERPCHERSIASDSFEKDASW